MYINRDSALLLKKYATQYPVVTVTGPRQTGKTTLCKHTFPEKSYISLEELDNREYAQNDPRGFLNEYSDGVIIDEIQRVPTLLSYIQGVVDKNNRKGEFILTGSAQLELTKNISQSLAGRTALLTLLPFSYTEIHQHSTAGHRELDNCLYNGFYPRVHADTLDATDYYKNYLTTYVERDIRQFYEIRNLNLFNRFLQLCASRVGQLLNYSNIANDCGVSVPTVQSWINILEQSYIIYRLQPSFANIKKRLVKTPKLYFYDTGLCAFLNGAKRVEHIQALPTRGNLFENFIITEFMKLNFHNNLKNQFYFYRDKTGKEIDLIIDDGLQHTPIEIKVSQTFTDDFFKLLNYYKTIFPTTNKGVLLYTGATQSRTSYSIYNFYDILVKFKNSSTFY